MADPSGLNAFFTPPIVIAVVVGVAIIYFWTTPSNEQTQPSLQQSTEVTEPINRLPVGKLTIEQISKYNGKNNERILSSISGRIFDLTKGRDFYGYPDGPYNVFAGCDATFCFASMSLDEQYKNRKDFSPTADQILTLNDWIDRYSTKYPIVGKLEGFRDLCSDCWRERDEQTIGDKNLKRLSLDELYKNAHRYWISVCGVIFNVETARFLYESNTFGKDISVAICKNIWNDSTYNKPISDIQGNQKELLKLTKCFKLFSDTYPFIGIVDPFKHSCIQIIVNSNRANDVTVNLLVYGYIRQNKYVGYRNAPAEIVRMISEFANSVVHINWIDGWEIKVNGLYLD